MSADRTDDSTLTAYYKHTVSDSGALTVWGHNSTSTVDWTTSANLTSGSACSTSSEFFNSNFSDSLTTNSTWSQANGGMIVGSNDATYTLASSYSGGTSGGYGGSSSYSGGQNWTWSDPNLSTYDAHALSEIRITPASPPDVGPVTYRSAPSPSFVMPPALVEDPEATAAAEQQQSWEEWLVDQGIGLIPIVGSGRDAYRAYLAGNNIGLAFNLGMLVVDVLTLGGGTAAKAVGKSALRAGKKTMAVAKSVFKSNGDNALKFVGNKLDNVGKGMMDNAAGGAGKLTENLANRKWPTASIEKAIDRHAGGNYTTWITDTGKRIYENPATGRQIVHDLEGGYFRIFQPNRIGSQKGTYLNMLGRELRPARVGVAGIRNPLLRDVDKGLWQQETHFFIQELLNQ